MSPGIIKEPLIVKMNERITKIYASEFSVAITDKEDLLLWGNFAGKVHEIHMPLKNDNLNLNLN